MQIGTPNPSTPPFSASQSPSLISSQPLRPSTSQSLNLPIPYASSPSASQPQSFNVSILQPSSTSASQSLNLPAPQPPSPLASQHLNPFAFQISQMSYEGWLVCQATTCAASRAESKCMTRASCTTLLCFSNTGTTSQSDIRQQIGTFSVLLSKAENSECLLLLKQPARIVSVHMQWCLGTQIGGGSVEETTFRLQGAKSCFSQPEVCEVLRVFLFNHLVIYCCLCEY